MVGPTCLTFGRVSGKCPLCSRAFELTLAHC